MKKVGQYSNSVSSKFWPCWGSEGEGAWGSAGSDQKSKSILEIKVFELVKIDKPLHFLRLFFWYFDQYCASVCLLRMLRSHFENSLVEKNIEMSLCDNSSSGGFQPLRSLRKVEPSSQKFKFELSQFLSSISNLLWITYKTAQTDLFQKFSLSRNIILQSWAIWRKIAIALKLQWPSARGTHKTILTKIWKSDLPFGSF